MRKIISKSHSAYSKFNNFLRCSTYIKLKDVLALIPSKPIKIEILNTLQLDTKSVNKSKINSEAAVEKLNKHTIDNLCSSFPGKSKLFRNRFSKGDKCLIVLLNSNVIGFEWFSTRNIIADERNMFRVSLPNDAIYAYDAYIIPEQRRKKLFPLLTQSVISLCQEINKRFIIALVEHENHTSIIAHSRLGFKITERKIYINIYNKIFSLKIFTQNFI